MQQEIGILLDGEYWAVLEFDEKDVIQIGSGKCKVEKCKIAFLWENPEGILKFFDYKNFDSRTAYFWAYYIGNQDIMIDRITESQWAYRWAYFFGNKDIMISKVVESDWAYMWALYIGNRDIMIDRITEPFRAYKWAEDIGNKDIMVARFPEITNRFY